MSEFTKKYHERIKKLSERGLEEQRFLPDRAGRVEAIEESEAARIEELYNAEDKGLFEAIGEKIAFESTVASFRKYNLQQDIRSDFYAGVSQDYEFDLSDPATFAAYTKGGIDPSIYENTVTYREADALKSLYEKKQEAKANLARKGPVAVIAGEFADPVHIVASIASAGIGAVWKTSKTTTTAAKYLSLGIGEEVIIEVGMDFASNDYEADLQSAFFIGSTVGTFLTGLDKISSISKKGKKIKNQDVVDNAVREYNIVQNDLFDLDPEIADEFLKEMEKAFPEEFTVHNRNVAQELYENSLKNIDELEEKITRNEQEIEDLTGLLKDNSVDEVVKKLDKASQMELKNSDIKTLRDNISVLGQEKKALNEQLNKIDEGSGRKSKVINELNVKRKKINSQLTSAKQQLQELKGKPNSRAETNKLVRKINKLEKESEEFTSKIKEERLKVYGSNKSPRINDIENKTMLEIKNIDNDIEEILNLIEASRFAPKARFAVSEYKKTGKLLNEFENPRLKAEETLNAELAKKQIENKNYYRAMQENKNYADNFKTDADIADDIITQLTDVAIDKISRANDHNIIREQKVKKKDVYEHASRKLDEVNLEIDNNNLKIKKTNDEIEKSEKIWGEVCLID